MRLLWSSGGTVVASLALAATTALTARSLKSEPSSVYDRSAAHNVPGCCALAGRQQSLRLLIDRRSAHFVARAQGRLTLS